MRPAFESHRRQEARAPACPLHRTANGAPHAVPMLPRPSARRPLNVGPSGGTVATDLDRDTSESRLRAVSALLGPSQALERSDVSCRTLLHEHPSDGCGARGGGNTNGETSCVHATFRRWVLRLDGASNRSTSHPRKPGSRPAQQDSHDAALRGSEFTRTDSETCVKYMQITDAAWPGMQERRTIPCRSVSPEMVEAHMCKPVRSRHPE